jgi:hypothetical protein
MAFHLTFVWNCKQALQNSPVFPRQLSIASVPAGEHQHCHARAASPRSGAVVRPPHDERISHSRFQGSCLSNGGRKVVGGRGQGNGKGKMVNGKEKNELK